MRVLRNSGQIEITLEWEEARDILDYIKGEDQHNPSAGRTTVEFCDKLEAQTADIGETE